MIAFLTHHFRYYTRNSWNQSTSYANNVKLRNLNIPAKLRDKAYEFLNARCDEYWFDIRDIFSDFECKTGYSAGFNGRSDGYIVMYDTECEDNRLVVMPGRSIDMYEDFEDWETEDIAERVKIVQAFDEMCDEIRDTFLRYIEDCDIKDVEVIRRETIRVAELVR